MEDKIEFEEACKNGDVEKVNKYIKLIDFDNYNQKVNNGLIDNYGYNFSDILKESMRNGHTEIVEILINLLKNNDKLFYNTTGSKNNGPIEIGGYLMWMIQYACESGNAEIVEKTAEFGVTNFIFAFEASCYDGHLHIVEKLIELSNDPCDLLYSINHGIEYARNGGHKHIVDKLMDYDSYSHTVEKLIKLSDLPDLLLSIEYAIKSLKDRNIDTQYLVDRLINLRKKWTRIKKIYIKIFSNILNRDITLEIVDYL
jgi:hypothetical protein